MAEAEVESRMGRDKQHGRLHSNRNEFGGQKEYTYIGIAPATHQVTPFKTRNAITAFPDSSYNVRLGDSESLPSSVLYG